MRDFPIVTDQQGLSRLETSEQMHDGPPRFDAVGGLQDETSSSDRWVQNSAQGLLGEARAIRLQLGPARNTEFHSQEPNVDCLEPSTFNL